MCTVQVDGVALLQAIIQGPRIFLFCGSATVADTSDAPPPTPLWYLSFPDLPASFSMDISLPEILSWKLDFAVCANKATLKCQGAYPLQGVALISDCWGLVEKYPNSHSLGWYSSEVFYASWQLSSRTESQVPMVLTGSLLHPSTAVFWSHFISIYTGILVSGCPYGEAKLRYHLQGILISWLSRDYSQIWMDVPFHKVWDRHRKLRLAFHWSYNHPELQRYMGNVVQSHARMFANVSNLLREGDWEWKLDDLIHKVHYS